MSEFRRIEIAPGIILDLTVRCGACGDREAMDTEQSRISGLCVCCDPAQLEFEPGDDYDTGFLAGLQGPFDGRAFQASFEYRCGYRDGQTYVDLLAARLAAEGFGPQA